MTGDGLNRQTIPTRQVSNRYRLARSYHSAVGSGGPTGASPRARGPRWPIHMTESGSYRFGAFELDARTGELRRRGLRVRLRGRPIEILRALLEHRGELVSRDALRARLWTADTFVDFDHGLNRAVNKLRGYRGIVPPNRSHRHPGRLPGTRPNPPGRRRRVRQRVRRRSPPPLPLGR